MAKLTKLPPQGIIDMLKGTIDFYEYMGIPCARTWPRHDESHISEATKAQRPYFAYINLISKHLPDNLQDAYREQASPTRLRWNDVLIRCYINGDRV